LLNISTGASTWAINSYDSALKLDPNNPYLYFQEGSVYLVEALSSSDADKSGDLAKAQTQLEKAVVLNPNYSDALYSLGLVYDALGQKDQAIAEFTKVQQLNPQNTDIPKILNNLNAGRSALQTATPPTENPPSTSTGTVTNPPVK
jgi:tetratricopeptide (TPR) repeat protein